MNQKNTAKQMKNIHNILKTYFITKINVNKNRFEIIINCKYYKIYI